MLDNFKFRDHSEFLTVGRGEWVWGIVVTFDGKSVEGGNYICFRGSLFLIKKISFHCEKIVKNKSSGILTFDGLSKSTPPPTEKL